jgi:hypothetical protein
MCINFYVYIYIYVNMYNVYINVHVQKHIHKINTHIHTCIHRVLSATFVLFIHRYIYMYMQVNTYFEYMNMYIYFYFRIYLYYMSVVMLCIKMDQTMIQIMPQINKKFHLKDTKEQSTASKHNLDQGVGFESDRIDLFLCPIFGHPPTYR